MNEVPRRDALTAKVLRELNAAREELLAIPKDQLIGSAIQNWYGPSQGVLKRASNVDRAHLDYHVRNSVMNGFWHETDTEVCLDLRDRILEYMDLTLVRLSGMQPVKPVLEHYISRVADTKLATVLREFNAVRQTQPNIAGIGFRTILPMVIRERAKRVDPNDKLATKDDLGFEPDLKAAVDHPILFSSAEKKLLRRHLSGGDKDAFDNVAHKPSFLIDKDQLDDAADLLNRLLPTIID